MCPFIAVCFTFILLGCVSQEQPGHAQLTCVGHDCARIMAAASNAPHCDYKTGVSVTPCQCATAPCIPPAVVGNIPVLASPQK